MIIRREQLEAMRAHLLKSMCTRLIRRLLAEESACGLDTSQLTREVSQLIEDGAAVGITGDDNAYRLLRFRVLAAPLLGSPLIQSVVIRVFHNLAWSADKRLSFLEREVLSRTKRIKANKPLSQD
jgi:hypothetical protein